MSSKLTVDLHVHSTASDGRMSPAEVVALAAEVGLSTIALTDHDTTAGLGEAKIAGATHAVSVLSGIELSSEQHAGSVDILGYCFDVESEVLQAALDRLREGRVKRAREVVRKLNGLGVTLQWSEVEIQVANGAIGRPHIARALKAAGHVSSVPEAFKRWININGPAYVPRLRQSPIEVIALIRAAGGVPVLAHPGRSGTISLVPQLVEAGLAGLEVYYLGHTKRQIRRLLRLTRKYNLVATGGSDFHGLSSNGTVSLGRTLVPPETVEHLLRARDT